MKKYTDRSIQVLIVFKFLTFNIVFPKMFLTQDNLQVYVVKGVDTRINPNLIGPVKINLC